MYVLIKISKRHHKTVYKGYFSRFSLLAAAVLGCWFFTF